MRSPTRRTSSAPLASPGWDPNREYSLPWQSGLTGIGYDPDKVGGEITSIAQLLDDPKLKGKVTFLTEMPDTMGLMILDGGGDPTKVVKADFDKAIDRLQKGVDSGQIRQFTGNDYSGPLAKGDIWACTAWSGDMVQLPADNPNLKFVIPEAGGMIWTDNMLIPKGGDVFTASTFMNFVYDPKIAAQIEAYVNYICPVEGADEAIKAIDASLASNQLIFPDADMLAKVKIFDATAADNKDVQGEVPGRDRRLMPCWLPPAPAGDPVPAAPAGHGVARPLLRRADVLPGEHVAADGLARRRLRVHLGLGQLLGRDLDVPRAVRALARVRRDRDRAAPCSSATRSRTSSRSAAAAGRACCCSWSSRRSSSRT